LDAVEHDLLRSFDRDDVLMTGLAEHPPRAAVEAFDCVGRENRAAVRAMKTRSDANIEVGSVDVAGGHRCFLDRDVKWARAGRVRT
jgi:hypothetical protein